MRFIKNLSPRSHIGFAELNSLNILNVNLRVNQLRLSHVHKIDNETGPSYLSELFIKTSEVHHHFTMNSIENFALPTVSGTAATTFMIMRLKIGILYPWMSNKRVVSMDLKVLQNNATRTQLKHMETDHWLFRT